MSDADPPIFRAPKRRKTATATAPKSSHQPSRQFKSGFGSEDDQPAEFVKPRIQVKARIRPNGMQFSNANVRQSNGAGHHDESMVLVPVTEVAESKANTHGLNNRFIMSGMGVGRDVIENDPNITAYVDAEMARRRQLQTIPVTSAQSTGVPTPQFTQTTNTQIDHDATPEPPTASSHKPDANIIASANPKPTPPQLPPSTSTSHQPTEIDLTTHPLPTPKPPSNPPKKKPPKPRLGRDGKPFRPRPRRGPNEEDIARGALVEQVLSEHDVRVGIAGSGQGVGQGQVDGGNGKVRGKDEEADERMEREFRAQFLERVSTGGAGNGGGNAGKSGSAGGEGKKDNSGTGSVGVLSSGPRLGGSRSARARMVAALERERERENEKEKTMGKGGERK